MTVRMSCGCLVTVENEKRPVCVQHPDAEIRAVFTNPPRFIARDCKVTGPYVRSA